MPKTKISEWSSTPSNNTDIDSINIAEGCAPSGINDAIRELMSQVKDLYSGTTGDAIGVAGGGTGQTSYTNGQLLIGNTTGNTLTKATLTAGSGISITNGGGSISIAATGGGDLVGPASSTDNAFTRFDGTTGKLVQNSTSATLSDDGTAFFKALSIDGTSNSMVFSSGAKIQLQTPTASANWFFETSATSLNLSTAQSGYFAISTAGSERARITGSGDFYLGSSSVISLEKFGVTYSSNSQYGIGINDSAGNTGATFQAFYSAGVLKGSISYNGATTLYNSTSDRRLKENIADSGSGLAKLANVKIRSFTWKDSQINTDFGVIAQELAEVAPEVVLQGDTGEKVVKTWQVDTSALVPAMIKAIQEQQVIIESLKARLDAANL